MPQRHSAEQQMMLSIPIAPTSATTTPVAPTETKTILPTLPAEAEAEVAASLAPIPIVAATDGVDDEVVSSCPLCGVMLPWSQLIPHTVAERHAAQIRLMDKWLSRTPAIPAAQLSLFVKPTSMMGSSAASMIIDDRVWLGSIDSARDGKFLDDSHISYIVDVNGRPTARDRSMYDARGISTLHLELNDASRFDIRSHFTTTHAFLDKAWNNNGRILVHCAAGVSRSATILISWLMRIQKQTLCQTLLHVRSRRAYVYPNRGFFLTLLTFDHELYGAYSLPKEAIELHEELPE